MPRKIIAADVYHHALGEDGSKVAELAFDPPFPEDQVWAALDRAYRLTNSVDTAWWDSPGVTMVGAAKEHGGCRSTSIGDEVALYFEDEGGATWETYRVAVVGFDKV